MKAPKFFYLIWLIWLGLLSCNKDNDNEPSVNKEKPYFGFNTKGSVNTIEQVALADSFFKELTPDIVKNLTIRVTGGTLSQTTYPADWTDAMITAWVRLQQKFNFKMIFVINGNDSPANQANLIQRWVDKGAKFEFLEMMNETYLPKYLTGNTVDHPEVTEAITPQKYSDTLLPNFWAHLDQFNLSYYVCLARKNPSNPNQQQSIENWNNTIISAITGKYLSRDVNVTLHLYTSEDNSGFDYNQINEVRASLPAGRHIAITEAGVLSETLSNEAIGQLAVEHYKQILNNLQPGDYLLDQVLYAPGPDNNTANLSSLHGVTQKGKRIQAFLLNEF